MLANTLGKSLDLGSQIMCSESSVNECFWTNNFVSFLKKKKKVSSPENKSGGNGYGDSCLPGLRRGGDGSGRGGHTSCPQ